MGHHEHLSLPVGEMALTPYNFSMLTGLAFTERLVPMEEEIKITDPCLDDWLGPIVPRLRAESVDSRALQSVLVGGLELAGSTDEQSARGVEFSCVSSLLWRIFLIFPRLTGVD